MWQRATTILPQLIAVGPPRTQTLPLPNTFAGFAKLSKNEWIQLLPLITTVLFVIVLSTSLFTPAPAPKKEKKARINNKIKLDEAKVVDSKTIKDIEDLDKDVVAFCRCWKSRCARRTHAD